MQKTTRREYIIDIESFQSCRLLRSVESQPQCSEKTSGRSFPSEFVHQVLAKRSARRNQFFRTLYVGTSINMTTSYNLPRITAEKPAFSPSRPKPAFSGTPGTRGETSRPVKSRESPQSAAEKHSVAISAVFEELDKKTTSPGGKKSGKPGTSSSSAEEQQAPSSKRAADAAKRSAAALWSRARDEVAPLSAARARQKPDPEKVWVLVDKVCLGRGFIRVI